jgi:thymidylate synthase
MQIICTENLDGSFSMFSMEEFIHIVMHPIEVLHEAFLRKVYHGDVGRNYSAQWRSYKGEAIAYNSDNNSFIYERHDQIKELIADMRENIMSTRLKVASWNPSEINKTALPPCRQFPSHRVPCSIMK